MRSEPISRQSLSRSPLSKRDRERVLAIDCVGMAPATLSPSSTSKPKLLPHQLVARDARSSYIQRVQTLAGPGAYVIPSTFQQATQLNNKIRDVQQSQYGRDFARKQRQQSDGAKLEQPQLPTDKAMERGVAFDTYRARRDHLRAMLQRMVRLLSRWLMRMHSCCVPSKRTCVPAVTTNSSTTTAHKRAGSTK